MMARAGPALAAGRDGAPTDGDRALAALLDEISPTLEAAPSAAATAAVAGSAAERVARLDVRALSSVRRREHGTILRGLRAEAAMSEPTYRQQLEQRYGAALAPETAQARLAAEVRACQTAADRLLRERGLRSGSVATRLRTLLADERLLYPDSEVGRVQAVADMNRALADLRPRLPLAFGALPLMPTKVQQTAPGQRPAKDPASGIYFVDVTAVRTRPAWTLRAAAYHEATPGHLVQMPLEQAARPHPLRLRYATGYMEGWPIYAEQLAADLGMYRGDPLGQIGHLQWRLFRLARGLADLKLGSGARPDEVRQTMLDIQGFEIAWITTAVAVERMAQEPGRSAAEALVALDLGAWRPAARRNWPAYHRAMLVDGPWPAHELHQLVTAAG